MDCSGGRNEVEEKATIGLNKDVRRVGNKPGGDTRPATPIGGKLYAVRQHLRRLDFYSQFRFGATEALNAQVPSIGWLLSSFKCGPLRQRGRHRH
jgi:hypothetical protein